METERANVPDDALPRAVPAREQDADLSRGLVDTVSFDGVTAQVKRVQGGETYFTLEPPDAAPMLYTSPEYANEDLLDFVRHNLNDLRRMRTEMRKRYEKGVRPCRYRTGEVVSVLGRPFMLRVRSVASGGNMRHAARGRAQTRVVVNANISLVELHVFKASDYDQRLGTFMSWAEGILLRNGTKIAHTVAERVDLPDLLPQVVRVRAMRDALARVDEGADVLWLSEDLVSLPPVCIEYAVARQLALLALPEEGKQTAEELSRARQAFVERACPGWERAREALGRLSREKKE